MPHFMRSREPRVHRLPTSHKGIPFCGIEADGTVEPWALLSETLMLFHQLCDKANDPPLGGRP